MQKTFEYWLRWILLYPVSIISSVLINLPLALASSGYNPNYRDYTIIPMEIVGPFCSSIAFVLVSSKMAPEFKKIILIVSATLWIVFISFYENNVSIISSITGVLATVYFKLQSD